MIPSACSRGNLSCVVLVSRRLTISFWSNALIEIEKNTILNKLPIFKKYLKIQRTGKIVKNCTNVISSHFFMTFCFEPLMSKFTLHKFKNLIRAIREQPSFKTRIDTPIWQ